MQIVFFAVGILLSILSIVWYAYLLPEISWYAPFFDLNILYHIIKYILASWLGGALVAIGLLSTVLYRHAVKQANEEVQAQIDQDKIKEERKEAYLIGKEEEKKKLEKDWEWLNKEREKATTREKEANVALEEKKVAEEEQRKAEEAQEKAEKKKKDTAFALERCKRKVQKLEEELNTYKHKKKKDYPSPHK